MINFLISRPIAVLMTYIALLVLGLVAATQLPVSLMPNVDIPKISVHISNTNASARELENTVVKKLRHSLTQTAHLANITSETMAGSAVIHLQFEYGTHTDFAFIEVNEKIDRAMASLPKEMDRPKIIKASATDIPVFYLNLTLKQPSNQLPIAIGTAPSTQHPATSTQHPAPSTQHPAPSTQFPQLSSFTQNVIQKRIEQLETVAMADVSGLVQQEIFITPNKQKLQATGITSADIENALLKNNIDLGNLLIRDGQYQYSIRVGNRLITRQHIGDVYLKKEGKLYQVKDLATVALKNRDAKGMVLSDGAPSVTLAVIKQSNARVKDLKNELDKLITYFQNDYPGIDFTVTRNQTQLLDYSIANLKQSLYIGAFLAFVIMFFFLKDFQSPLLIGISIPVSLIISFLFFHLAKLSVNIVSLSGMVLGIGMMIDNAIIVIDNIHQHRGRGTALPVSCVNGTNEVFRPMLSSVLTTCAVFIPLIFIGNISGAIFYDQAIAVTIGLLVSLGVSITLIPVLYHIFYGKAEKKEIALKYHHSHLTLSNQRKNHATPKYFYWYEKGLRVTLRKQPLIWATIFLMLMGTLLLFNNLSKSKFPPIAKNETLLFIDWNENINLAENQTRTSQLLLQLKGHTEHTTALIGEQQFLLDQNAPKTTSECLLYIKTPTRQKLSKTIKQATGWLHASYPGVIVKTRDVGNIFEQLFADNIPVLEARLRTTGDFGDSYNQKLETMVNTINNKLPGEKTDPVVWDDMILLRPDNELLTLYQIDYNQVQNALKQAFQKNQVFAIKANQQYIPVILGDKPNNLQGILNNLTVKNKNGKNIRLSTLFSQLPGKTVKTIYAAQEGEYYPISLSPDKGKVKHYINKITEIVRNNPYFEVGFTGSYFTNKELIKDLAIILCISLLLLYFILASQFESVLLPFIVLLEVPIDIFGAFLFLKIFGAGINIMSLIGIVVMSGIIINDSILKIDTINRLRLEGCSTIRAIYIGGQRRLKPILMTSLTTILALVPFLFTRGMGSDLQKPLALAVIGGMLVGTMVSLYFIPLCYYYLDTLRMNLKNKI